MNKQEIWKIIDNEIKKVSDEKNEEIKAHGYKRVNLLNEYAAKISALMDLYYLFEEA